MSAAVVSAEWLSHHLDDLQVVVVDCRFALLEPTLGQQQYTTGHLPGAYYLDLERDLSGSVQRHGGRHPLPDPATLATKLEQMGIHSAQANQPATLVVAYDDSRLAFAARLWWLLRYLGHSAVAVLDGGFTRWQEAGYPVTTAIPAPRSGNFSPQVQTEQVVDITGMKARQNQPGVVLVDAREGERYRGEREPIDPISGHIPGAVNYPWQAVTNVQGYLRSQQEQQQHWAELADAREIVVYCGSGVTACVNLLSLEIASIPTGKLYAGSWSDWCSYLS